MQHAPNPDSAKPLLQANHATKSFSPSLSLGDHIMRWLGYQIDTRAVQAVDAVSLTLYQGEVLGLVGESGCGKSTLGRMLAGIIPPSNGTVKLENTPVMNAQAKPVKNTTRIQMVFQDPFASLDPRVRVGETIGEGPLCHGLVDAAHLRAYVARWLETVGLPHDAADKFPHQFSGGQRQRVAIARALAMQPDILICDEPVASLDVSIQAQIINLFLELKKTLNLTMLFISHDLGVVRHISDRIAVMYLGRIVELGPTTSVYDSPYHPYTRALLDSIPKLVTQGDELVHFKAIEGELPSPLSPPPGCHFHLRCPHAKDLCKTTKPALNTIDPASERMAACFFPLNA
ncbi:MAG: ABC transporter ATP-binding protein [Methylocystaceae bacterium]|nr:ABC transporter ATP-binding protein [Methylocystaceae bacterium]